MKPKYKNIFAFLLPFWLVALNSNSQINTDSLLNSLKNAKQDTNQIKTLLLLAEQYSYSNINLAINYAYKAKKIAVKIKNPKFIAKALNELGLDLADKTEFDSALVFYHEALVIYTNLNNKIGISTIKGNLGNIYRNLGNNKVALKNYLSALKIDENIGNSKGVQRHLANLANIYIAQENLEMALTYCARALKIARKLGDENNIAIVLGNIGSIYLTKKDFNQSIKYFNESNIIATKLKNQFLESNNLGNLGNAYKQQGDSSLATGNKIYSREKYSKALEYYQKSIMLITNIGNKIGVAMTFGNIGVVYLNIGDIPKAEHYLLKSTILSDSLKLINLLATFEKYLSSLYEQNKKPMLALAHFKKYIAARDSITNDENTKAQARTEMQYEFDKQQTADSIKTAEHAKQERLKHNQEIQQQKMYTYGGIIGFGLMLIVAFVSFRAFRNKQKANLIIAHQKELVEEKQKEILDSIHYAKRIQQALLPNEKYIDKYI